MSNKNNDVPRKLSRAEAEELCILDAVGSGTTAEELTRRLGLPPGLIAAVKEALGKMVDAGWVAEEESAFRRSAAGAEYLEKWCGLGACCSGQ